MQRKWPHGPFVVNKLKLKEALYQMSAPLQLIALVQSNSQQANVKLTVLVLHLVRVKDTLGPHIDPVFSANTAL